MYHDLLHYLHVMNNDIFVYLFMMYNCHHQHILELFLNDYRNYYVIILIGNLGLVFFKRSYFRVFLYMIIQLLKNE